MAKKDDERTAEEVFGPPPPPGTAVKPRYASDPAKGYRPRGRWRWSPTSGKRIRLPEDRDTEHPETQLPDDYGNDW